MKYSDFAASPATALTITTARPLLLRWFARHARILPWRAPHPLARPAASEIRSPYAVWISEVMLQQTQVATVIPYFERWMTLFPDPAALARAPEDKVLQAWAGLGYYARARNLQKAARILSDLKGWPASVEAWKALPGVGDYTAGAISSLALGLRAPILDGNVVRVFSRLLSLNFLPGDNAQAKQAYWDLAARWADHPKPGAVNEGLMELGALVCVPAAPRCDQCPLTSVCMAFEHGRQATLPPLKKRVKAEVVLGAAVRVHHAGKVLTERRGPGASSGTFLAGHDLFPLFLFNPADKPAPGWQAAFTKLFPGSRLQNVRAGGRVRHAIMSKRYDIEIWDCELVTSGAAPASAKPPVWPGAQWVDATGIEERLTNSLAKKIWKAR